MEGIECADGSSMCLTIIILLRGEGATGKKERRCHRSQRGISGPYCRFAFDEPGLGTSSPTRNPPVALIKLNNKLVSVLIPIASNSTRARNDPAMMNTKVITMT